ncbi:MAG: hypothetical protein Q8O95_01780 [bacterium]|nr:hypothetical protein [bacterium]
MPHLNSPSKINLTLDVMGRDERAGKHFVNTVFYIDETIFDEIEVRPKLGGVKNLIHCDYPAVPLDETNTISKALELLGIRGAEVMIRKRIPIKAGLGGGSSNAAAVLKHFGEQKGIPLFQLQELATQIGADVPVFLAEGNVVYCEGFGDKIIQSWQINPLKIKYLETGMEVSTPEAYARLDLDQCGRNSVKTEALIQVLNAPSGITAKELASYVHNDFEDSFFEASPQWKGKGNLCGSGGMLWSIQHNGR